MYFEFPYSDDTAGRKSSELMFLFQVGFPLCWQSFYAYEKTEDVYIASLFANILSKY